MGGEQSSQEKLPGAPVQLRKTCYYEVLGVERLASDDEIKKAYRKKALELHPDRNYGDVDNATKQFAEVQSAYQVLSDPQERAWYDSHRETILRNEDAGTDDHFEHNVRLTSAEDVISLVRKFTTNLSFDDKPNGFFGGLRLIFEKLAEEEAAACRWDGLDVVNWPGFGISNDDYDQVVKPFYSAWMGFTTKKTYSWKETYNYAEAPDRRIRRLMEKENKHLREEAVRGFNDAVRSLVSFVRKRDPRYIPNRQSELDRQKILQDAAAAQAARSRAAHQAKIGEHIVPEWDKARSTEQDATFSDTEPSDEEHFECVLCGKTFKSEKQYESHEKSKKHVKAVQQLRRQMHKEDKQLNLDGKTDLSLQLDETREEEQPDVTGYNPVSSQAEDALETLSQDIDIEHDKDPNASTDEELSSPGSPTYSSNDEYISRAAVKDRLQPSTSHKGDEDLTSSVDDLDKMTEDVLMGNVKDTKYHSERGKAKARRGKKTTREEKTPGNVCVKCGNEFSSKTQLFGHINREGHAQATTQPIKAKREKHN